MSHIDWTLARFHIDLSLVQFHVKLCSLITLPESNFNH